MSAIKYESISEPPVDRSDSRGDFVSLLDVFEALWASKWKIVLAAVAAAAIANLASRLLEKQYEASIVISPVSEETSSSGLGAIGALATQFTGLASFATSGNNRKAEYVAILQSEELTTEFIKQNNLLPVLYARNWDAAANQWKVPKNAPTLWIANRLFRTDIRRTSADAKTSLLTMTIAWSNATMSAQWANGIVAMANQYIRAKAISDGERNLAYLNEQLAKSNVVAVQNSISALLENEIKKIMLARGSEEYAFKIIDPATVPERPSSPNPIIWSIVGSIAGILLASLAVLAMSPKLRRFGRA
jgi:LPS O-antigen subunit length determinant protein (WzzB/FepE family)